MPILPAAQGLSSSFASCMLVKLPAPSGNLAGQTIIVSGSNQGLGFEASRHLLRLGVSRLIMGVRNLEKGEAARSELLQSTGRDASVVEVWELDMASYSSVKRFASRAATLPRLDAFLANAGLATQNFSMVEDNETTITVNVVSTFLLTTLLIPQMRETASKFSTIPRISIVNSALHFMAPLNELDVENEKGIFPVLNDEKTAQMGYRYPLSKLLVLFGVRALADRLEQSKEPLVILNAPNPSWCKSQLLREDASVGKRVGEHLIARSTEMGSRALVHGIMSGRESSGQYLDNCQVKRPACTVTNEKGAKIQDAFYISLAEKIEQITPGAFQVAFD